MQPKKTENAKRKEVGKGRDGGWGRGAGLTFWVRHKDRGGGRERQRERW